MTQHKDNAPRAASDEGWTVPVDPAKPGLGRRTVLAGAAWSVPIVAATIATPLAAASVCVPATGLLDWGSQYTRTNSTNGQGVASTDDGQSIPVTVSAVLGAFKTANAATLVGISDALAISTVTTTGTTDLSVQNAYNINVTITFAQPVTDVTFTMYAVNRNATFTEYVMAPAADVVATSPGMTSSGPDWHYPANNPATAESITYTIPGPVTTFTVYMSRPTTAAGAEGGVSLSNLQFTVPC